MAEQPIISLKNVSKRYSRGNRAVKDLNLDIARRDFLVLVGPSGCGKSTTLRMIAGLEEISDGELYLDGKFANYVSPQKRNLAMVFQNYALYPQLTVYDNIAFSLKIRGVPKEEIKTKVFEAAKVLSLGPYLDRYPKELSGGQMQRVALGRAIVKDCPVYLMDEPLSNLDAKLRVQMRSEIVRLMKRLNGTCVYVTHDQTEAMTMATRIVVMNEGYVQQIGTPDEVYNQPANLFVATFIGNPPMNVVEGHLCDDSLVVGDWKLSLPSERFAAVKKEYERNHSRFLEVLNLQQGQVLPLLRDFLKKSKKGKFLTSNEGIEALNNLKAKIEEEGGIAKRRYQELGEDSPSRDDFLSLLNGLETTLNEFRDAALSSRTYLRKEETVAKKKKFFDRFKKKEEGKSKETELTEFLTEAIGFYEEAMTNPSASVLVGFRAESLVAKKGGPLKAKIDLVEPLGSSNYLHFPLNGKDVIAITGVKQRYQAQCEVGFVLPDEDIFIFDPITGRRIEKKE